MNLTVFAANTILDGGVIPATLYVQLHDGDPDGDGTANVATDTARRSFTRTAAAGGIASNDGTLTWLDYTGDEVVTHLSIWDDPDPGEGNCWFVGEWNAPGDIDPGFVVQVAAGALDVEFDTWPFI